MRHLLTALLLLSALALPTAAHATQIDDFVLTSAHHTYTFSLTTPYYTGPTFGHFLVNFYESGPGTIDGVAGYTLGGYFYNCCGSGIDFNVPGVGTYQMRGPDLQGYSTPFLTGTFQYSDDPFSFNPNLVVAKDGPYTLTITPEATNTATPEPSTLALLATGSLGVLMRTRRRLIT